MSCLCVSNSALEARELRRCGGSSSAKTTVANDHVELAQSVYAYAIKERLQRDDKIMLPTMHKHDTKSRPWTRRVSRCRRDRSSSNPGSPPISTGNLLSIFTSFALICGLPSICIYRYTLDASLGSGGMTCTSSVSFATLGIYNLFVRSLVPLTYSFPSAYNHAVCKRVHSRYERF